MVRRIDRLVRYVRKRYRSLRDRRRGRNVCIDLATLLQPRIIFDVGANVGQSAVRFRRYFRRARIHCFEPSAPSADRIRARALRNVEVHELALGSAATRAMLARGHDSAIFRISDQGDERISIVTLDAFCAERGIDHIDFLKVDTEGHDLEVLKGATVMLSTSRIAAVQVEAGLNPDNKFHVPFETLKAFLEAYDYRLFGIYDQVNEWPTRQLHLRRANPLFISRELYTSKRRAAGSAAAIPAVLNQA